LYYAENQGILISMPSGSLVISNSLISHFGSIISTWSLLTSNNNTIDTLAPLETWGTYRVQYFNSHYCHAIILSL